MRSRIFLSKRGVDAAVMALAPLPFLLCRMGDEPLSTEGWRLGLAAVAMLCCFFCALTLSRRPKTGMLAGSAAVFTAYLSLLPFILSRPDAALACSVLLIYLLFLLWGFSNGKGYKRRTNYEGLCLLRAKRSALAAFIVTAIGLKCLGQISETVIYHCSAASTAIALIFYLRWLVLKQFWIKAVLSVLFLTGLILLPELFSLAFTAWYASTTCLILVFLLAAKHPGEREQDYLWWEILINHPGRILFTTFFLLCLIGSFFLTLSVSSAGAHIAYLDALFTSVSAVCVTGLSVLDTAHDFSFIGQVFILVMIQLGGLGIMSITTVALHVMGRRISLKHEKVMTSMTDTSHQDLFGSLKTILGFTIIVEAAGALLLFLAFVLSGDSASQAAWRGIFTSISSYCNAGFALQSDSLVSYQHNPLVLHTIALLIIFGGLAPSSSLLIPRWIKGKPVPIAARIALVTSLILLIGGMCFILALEWGGALAGFSLFDKLQNAWFQSVTLRTAGFNSVELSGVSNASLLIMLFFMFIGGSPGGTAGGVKTTSIAILAMIFWANIYGQSRIVIQYRRLHVETVYKAVTVIMAGVAVWLVVVVMLQVTQNISARQLIFEATSAIGTVGLTIGATPLLDEIGRIIIVIAMFAGRIGPVSLFMLLNNEQDYSDNKYPVERISIT